MAIIIGYGRQLYAGGGTSGQKGEGQMILELVEFNSPKGWSRQQVAEDARSVIPKWRANKELLRKHFLLELNGKTVAGIYIWPSVEAAQKVHDEERRQSVIRRTGGAANHTIFRFVPDYRQREGHGDGIPRSRRNSPGGISHCCSCYGRACPGHPRLSKERKTWMPGTRPGMTVRETDNALGRLYADRRCGSDCAQCDAARTDRSAWNGRGHPCAVPFRISVRGTFPGWRSGHHRGATPDAAAGFLAMGARRRFHANRGHGDHALSDGPAFVCGGLRLYQDRTGTCRAFR